MTELPFHIRTIVPAEARPGVDRWWSGLENTEREAAADLWDERREFCFFTPQPDAVDQADAWTNLPRVIGGRFIPHDDSVRMSEWLDDWHEYWLGHEDVFILPREVIAFRTFSFGQPCRVMRITDRGVVEFS